MAISRKTLGIFGSDNDRDSPLLAWLEQILPVRFERRNAGEASGIDAAIFWAENVEPVTYGVPSLRLPSRSSAHRDIPCGQVQFGDSAEVPKEFRSLKFRQEDIGCGVLKKRPEDGVVMARLEGEPLWVRWRQGENVCDLSVMPLPEINADFHLYHYFHSRNFIRLLPLIDFVRRIAGEEKWTSPALKACFQFDDPNLHSEHYGWLDFRKLAVSAGASHYHVALATVPLDAWLIRKRAAEFFRANRGQISLLIHGNDHIHCELNSFQSREKATASMAQALKRIERAEKGAGVEICRVMAPPHGLCSEEVFAAMTRLGFEAASTTVGGVHTANPDKSWSHAVGLRVSEVVAGLPVLPRFRFKTNRCYAAIHLAAYLQMPILPYGHHEDVSTGLGILEEVAGSINALGKVEWMRMSEIARHNYQTQTRGAVFQVRAFSRKLTVTVPSECHYISIERPSLMQGQAEGLRLCVPGGKPNIIDGYRGESLPVPPGGAVEISSVHPNAIDRNAVETPPLNLWASGRRLLCEARDRFAPVAGRFRRSPVT